MRDIPKSKGDANPGKKDPEKPQSLSLDKIAKGVEETKAREREKYEKYLLTTEKANRDKINNLSYNIVYDAIKNNDGAKQLIGNTILQKQDITKMRAFQHKDGRILLGPIDHVRDAFKNYGHDISNTDLDNLKVGDERNEIKRIAIDENLLEILRDRGFKADIAKRGIDGELKKVVTLGGKWNNKEDKMDMTFEEYKGDQPNGGRVSNASPDLQYLINIPTGQKPSSNDGMNDQTSGDMDNQSISGMGNQSYNSTGDQSSYNSMGNQPYNSTGDQSYNSTGN